MKHDDLATWIAQLHPQVYHRLHYRWRKAEYRPSTESLAMLNHLAISGPLTVTEAAQHFDRAQSAMSELIDRLYGGAAPDTCQSCGRSINDGTYCQYCVDESGRLQAFSERFERMVLWSLKQEPDIERSEAEKRTRDYMRTMPAWKDHPELNA